MISESDEDDTGLLTELAEWLEDARGVATEPEDVEVLFQMFGQSIKALAKLVKLCVMTSEQGEQLGMVSAIRTTTILRVLAAELTGREVTLEMPGVVTFHPQEVDHRG